MTSYTQFLLKEKAELFFSIKYYISFNTLVQYFIHLLGGGRTQREGGESHFHRDEYKKKREFPSLTC